MDLDHLTDGDSLDEPAGNEQHSEFDSEAGEVQDARSGSIQDKKARFDEIHVALPIPISCRGDLDQVIRDHQFWLESVLNPRKRIGRGRANLLGANLSGMDLSGVNLSGATFIDTNLTDTKLVGANLTGVNFSGALLVRTDLSNAKLRHANFSEAKLEGVELSNADLRGAKIHLPKVSPDEGSNDVGISRDEKLIDEVEALLEDHHAKTQGELFTEEGTNGFPAETEPYSEESPR